MDIVSLKYDYIFKHLMTNEKVRKHFISDVLGIPLKEIKSVRMANTFLWKRYYRQKQGILDVLLELYCRPPGFTVRNQRKYLAGGLQSGFTASFIGVQYK